MKITSVGAIRIAIDFSTPVLVSWVYTLPSPSPFPLPNCLATFTVPFSTGFFNTASGWFTQRVCYCGAGFVMEMRSCQRLGWWVKRLKCLHPLICSEISVTCCIVCQLPTQMDFFSATDRLYTVAQLTGSMLLIRSRAAGVVTAGRGVIRLTIIRCHQCRRWKFRGAVGRRNRRTCCSLSGCTGTVEPKAMSFGGRCDRSKALRGPLSIHGDRRSASVVRRARDSGCSVYHQQRWF